MIFNKEYDNSLWCMINGDKSRKHLITNFIHELPQEFINQIKNAIKEQQSIVDIIYINPDLLPNTPKNLSGTSDLIDNVQYSYLLDTYFSELRIMKIINNGNSYEQVFCLHLEQTELPLKSVLDAGVIGSIEYNTKEKKSFQDFPVINNYNIEYSISKNMFGHTLTCTEVYGGALLRSKQSLDLTQLPQDIKLEDFPVNTKHLSVERLVELEKYLRQEISLDSLSQEDLAYLDQAKKLPLEEFLKDREYYAKHFYIVDEIKYSCYLMDKYNCTKTELYDRCVTANAIRRYNNKLFNKMYKIRKKALKQLTK